jgi:hypothetical protein
MSAAQYVIDIAAQMSGGDQTVAELDALTATISGGGKGAAYFSEAIAGVSKELDAARTASKVANAALAAGTAEYQALEKAALQAAKAAEKSALEGSVPPELQAQLDGATAAVNTYSKTMIGLRGAVTGAADASKTANAALAEGQATYAGLQAAATAAAQAEAQAAASGAVPSDVSEAARSAAEAVTQYASTLAELKGASDAAGTALATAKANLASGAAEFLALKGAAKLASDEVKAAATANAGVVPAAMASKLAEANAAVERQASLLKGLETEAKRAADAEDKLGTTMGNVKKLSGHVDKSLTGQSESLSKVQGALGQIGGPLGSLGQKFVAPLKGFQDLSVSMGASKAKAMLAVVGFAAVAAAVIAVTYAVIAGAAKVAAWAISLADANRNTDLANEALGILDPKLAALTPQMRDLTAETGMSTEGLRGLAKQLKAAGVSAGDMPAALRAAALAETALGQGGAQEYFDKIKKAGGDVADFAREAQHAFGGIVAKQMKSLDKQAGVFKSSIAGLFGELNIEPALDGLATLIGLFDETSVSGQAIKFLFETVFQPIIDYAQKAAFYVEAFALGFIIGITKAYIAVKPYIKQIEEFFGYRNTSLEDTCAGVTKVAEVMAKIFVGAVVVFGALAAIVGMVIGSFVALQVGIVAAIAIVGKYLIQGITAVVGFISGLPATMAKGIDAIGTELGRIGALISAPFMAAKDWLMSFSFADAGAAIVNGIVSGFNGAVGAVSAMVAGLGAFFSADKWIAIGGQIIDGIVQGITGAAGKALAAIGNVAGSLVGAAKGALGIHSPSKLMAEDVGGPTVEGVAVGVDAGASDVQSAMADAVTPGPEVTGAVDELSGALGAPANDVGAESPLKALDAGPAPISELQSQDALEGNLNALPGAAMQAPEPAAPAAAPEGKGGGAGGSVDFTGATFIFNGVEGAEGADARFGELLTRILEGDAAQIGAESKKEEAA